MGCGADGGGTRRPSHCCSCTQTREPRYGSGVGRGVELTLSQRSDVRRLQDKSHKKVKPFS